MSTIKLKMKKLDYETNESYKTLRTNLQFCGEDKKVIVMTSCTPNEGKSTVATYLASAMAQGDSAWWIVRVQPLKLSEPL